MRVFIFIFLLLFHAAASSYPLESVRPGLRGYALSAGAGNSIERFEVEVLALQYDMGLGFPLVLVRASGPLIEAAGGVAAGMSGSPVYLPTTAGDALLGAIAYVFPNSDHSLALVTPIDVMKAMVLAQDLETFGAEFLPAETPQPIATPILLSGLGERAASQLRPLFRTGQQLLPVQLGRALVPDESKYQLEPGSAVSVQLARGDVTIAAVGTVTSIDNGQVLAFGHPLLGDGEVSFALAPAFVSHIVPSSFVPFKLADSGQTLLGSITQDRPAAVAGQLGVEPAFLPVSLTMVGPHGRTTKTFELSNDERYLAPLLASATLQLLDEVRQQFGAGSAELAWEIHFQDGEVLTMLEQLSSSSDIGLDSAILAAMPLAILANNIFRAAQLERLALNITYENVESYARVVEVVAEDEKLVVGDDLVVHVRLQPYRAEPLVRTFKLQLPETDDEVIEIRFRGGLEPAAETEGLTILSFGELLVALQDIPQASELIIEALVGDDPVQLERISFPYIIEGDETISVTLIREDDNDDATPEVLP